MKLNLQMVGTLFRNEIRMVLRDRRTILTSIVLPLIVMPLMLFGSSWTNKKREQKLAVTEFKFTVTGSRAPFARELVAATRERLAKVNDPKAQKFLFQEQTEKDPDAALNRGDIQLILVGLNGTEADQSERGTNVQSRVIGKGVLKRAESSEDREIREEQEALAEGAPLVRLVFRGDRDDSSTAAQRMADALDATRRVQRSDLLNAHGFPLPVSQVAAVAESNLASKGQVAGLGLGRTLPLLLLLFVLSGGALVATDLLAGEKERGTLETLLTTAAGRVEIIAAKHLVILAVGLIITLIQTISLLVYVGFKLIPVPSNFAAAVTPAVAIVFPLLFLPIAALAASVLLLTSGYAKTHKEAQLYFFPVLLLGLLPALTPFLPGLPLRSAIVLVPVANLALAIKEVLIGSFDWPMIIISWLVTAGVAVWTTRVSVRFLSAERLITAVDRDVVEFQGGPALFGRHVLRWYAILWGLLLIVSNFTATLDLRLQIVINLVGLFFSASLCMIWRYHLNPRQALAFRLPKPVVWLALPLAAPGGLLTGVGLFRLAELFVPVPPKMVEGFSQELMPEGISVAQLLFFLAVMPGIFEEIAFRGLLLHGLHYRLRPVPLVLVVGLVFGLFHGALFRLAPTAFLGILFGSVTLLTGSIFPSMIWHALNNSLGVLAALYQIPLNDLDPGVYIAGAVMLAGAFAIIWSHRTLYPGLKRGVRKS